MSETKTMGQVYLEAFYEERGWALPVRPEDRAKLFALCDGGAAAVIAAHEAQRSILASGDERHKAFFARIWAAREGGMDGSDIEDAAVDCGLAERVQASAPCGEACACAEVGLVGFPGECVRLIDEPDAQRRQPEVRLDSGGKLDEYCADGVGVHIERMDERDWWIGFSLPDGTQTSFRFGGAEYVRLECDDGTEHAVLTPLPAWPAMRPMSEPPTEEQPEAELLFLRSDGEFELGPGPQFGVEYLGWWALPEVPR